MATKTIRFTALLDKEEKEMLKKLIELMRRSGSSVIATLIREKANELKEKQNVHRS